MKISILKRLVSVTLFVLVTAVIYMDLVGIAMYTRRELGPQIYADQTGGTNSNMAAAGRFSAHVPVSSGEADEISERPVNQNVFKVYIDSNDLQRKLALFNQRILRHLREPHMRTEPPEIHCSQTMKINDMTRTVRGHTKRLADIVDETDVLVGTKGWLELQKHVTTSNRNISSPSRKSIDSAAHSIWMYDVTAGSASVTSFILSSLRHRNASVVELSGIDDAYYDCYVPAHIQNARDWLNTTGAMTPAECYNRCSQNVAALSTPTRLQDYALHIDYTRVRSDTRCRNYALSADEMTHYATHSLHNSRTGDILTSLDIVQNGGVVYEYGQILTRDNELLLLPHCYDPTRDRSERYQAVLPHADVTCVRSDVFTISDVWSENYYHRMIDEVVKLSTFVDFIKQRPQMSIHVGTRAISLVRRILPMFGLTNPVVSGVVKTASAIFRPHGTSCTRSNFVHTRTTRDMFRAYIARTLIGQGGSFDGGDSDGIVVFLKRTERQIINRDDVTSLVQRFARRIDRQLVVFDDSDLPSFEETMTLFYRADVIIGVHGAGLANLLFSRPGATLIEFNCKGRYVCLCYSKLCMQLGMRCYGTETTANINDVTELCDESGVHVNVTELSEVLGHVASYVAT